MLCRPSQWVMPKYKLLIAIHLVGFVQQSITWSGTKAYIPLTVRARLLITWPTISPPGVGVKCDDDETNEQRILRAPAIALADHRAVYDAKCGHPQGVKLLKCGHLRTGGGAEKQVVFADVLYGRSLTLRLSLDINETDHAICGHNGKCHASQETFIY